MEWRIFFIGPMGNDPSAKKANDYKKHLPKLCDYLVNHLENARGYAKMEGQEHVLTNGSRVDSVFLKKDDDLIIVITPIDLYGPRDIPENVFDAIDEADLIIADLSAGTGRSTQNDGD